MRIEEKGGNSLFHDQQLFVNVSILELNNQRETLGILIFYCIRIRWLMLVIIGKKAGGFIATVVKQM